MGLFGGSSKQSAASSSSTAISGVGGFAPVNDLSISRKIINFNKPLEVLAFGAVIALGFYAWKRFK